MLESYTVLIMLYSFYSKTQDTYEQVSDKTLIKPEVLLPEAQTRPQTPAQLYHIVTKTSSNNLLIAAAFIVLIRKMHCQISGSNVNL